MKKYSKRILSSLIALIMFISILPADLLKASAVTVIIKTGDIITFGSYPQTRVTDLATLTALNKSILSADGTVTYFRAKYKRVYFTQYTSAYDGLPTADLARTYQDDNGYYPNNGYWFKIEPIRWRVLSNNYGELLVVSESILDTKVYNQTNSPVTWENSSIRSWLNKDFYSAAFSSVEKPKIESSPVFNGNNIDNGTPGGNTTSDMIFLPSFAEAITPAYGFNTSNTANDPLRQIIGTDYSMSQGLYAFTTDIYIGKSAWWLRSPGYASTNAGYVRWDGTVVSMGNAVNTACVGIRPALKIFTSVTGVTVSPATLSIAAGSTKQLTATVSPIDASNKAVTWGSTNPGVAMVSGGYVTAKTPGKAQIIVTTQNGGFTAICNVTVKPAAPAGLTAKSASYNSIKLSWTAVSGVTGYAIYRYNAGTDSYPLLAKTATLSYTNKSLTAGKTYRYKIRAYKTTSGTDIYSDYTAVVNAVPVPATPGSFTVAKAGSTSLKISWSVVAGVSGYEVFRAASSTATPSPVKTTTSLSFTNTGLTKNKTYYYKVRAFKTVNGEKIYGKFTAVKSAKPY